jgi:Fe-S-cluster containining protein
MSQETNAPLADLARQRQAELDERIARWRQGPGAGVRLWCGPGCGNCCSLAVNATYPEALAITATLSAEHREHVAAAAARIIAHARQSQDARNFLAGYRQAVGPCPFLDGTGNCSIYHARPLACRALLATRPPDWCGINLAGLPAFERDPFLASLDRTVVAYPTHYAAVPQELAAAFERGLLFAMLRSNGFAFSGLLPLLVWLTIDPGFATALADGTAALRSYLADRHLDRPFLVQIEAP